MINGNLTKWADILQRIGFPIVVAVFLLLKVVPVIERLSAALEHTNAILTQHERTSQGIEDLLRRYVIEVNPRRPDPARSR